ncbi:GTPase family protein [Roseofilum casamattae]|uniref:50S ribosome-binding GTPase n=1 Tax=Roseofilum casamattae BLCC-M143 TaxID=3022442 RepID=A0ABT7BYL0_9CYAN|nr:GTPase [Roseofilum casamattae]MDJ1184160.1 50S ribosome-binding GTPase [Roseofilum casamattae BLCC-M143]
MVRFKLWQWIVLVTPIASIIILLLVAAGWQIHVWGISWIWAIFILVFLGWRWLLVAWTRPMVRQVEEAVAAANANLEAVAKETEAAIGDAAISAKIETALETILKDAKDDRPIWEDWNTFFQRCQDTIVAVAQAYGENTQYPLLNIYIPQAYGLIQGTTDDVGRTIAQLSPVLNQVTVGQAYQAYELYRKLEPSARKFLRVWDWAQWVLNPAAAAAKQTTRKYSNKATQELLMNLSQMLRETALRNLCRQAIVLYGNVTPPELQVSGAQLTLPKAKTETLREIIAKATPAEELETQPLNLLVVGRTGAGKSSLINTLFQAERAEVDVLPNTDKIQNYQWQGVNSEELILWDTPGYEQVNRADLTEQVLDYGATADLVVLVTPALDPALQMDLNFLQRLRSQNPDLPMVGLVTQVDRLRPIREWSPPYDWERGDRPKERAIREATEYRQQQLSEICNNFFPMVTADPNLGRPGWNTDVLSVALMEAIGPVKEERLARFLRDRDARTLATAKIIDRYTFQMATTQGLTALLKSPVLRFVSTLATGSPTLAYLLAEQIPIEQLPVVIGKLQMAYDLFSLLSNDPELEIKFELLALWPRLLDNPGTPDQNAWAFGHALVEYWLQDLTIDELGDRMTHYLKMRQ